MPDPSVCARLLTLLLQLNPFHVASPLLTSELFLPTLQQAQFKISLLRCKWIPVLHTQCLHKKGEVGDKYWKHPRQGGVRIPKTLPE